MILNSILRPTYPYIFVKSRIQVPNFVKAQYKNPTQKTPARSSEPAAPEPTQQPRKKESVDLSQITEEQDEWLRQLVALQTGILKQHMEDKPKPVKKVNDDRKL